MRIGILGPGALGCLFAAKIFNGVNGQDTVLLIDHDSDRASDLNRQGIICESGKQHNAVQVPVYSDPERIAPLDIILSCVKSYDLPASLDFIAPLLTPSTILIFLQNGIAHLVYDELPPGSATPVFASSSEGATRLGPGHIRHAGSGHTWLGFGCHQTDYHRNKLLTFLDILQKSGFASSISNNIKGKLWAKLIVNVGINGLTAVHNCSNGRILDIPALRQTQELLVREAERVALAAGIDIEDEPLAATIRVCEKTADNISSMLQDVRARRTTEIDAINGSIAKTGREYKIPTPENDTLIKKIHEIENRYGS